jgi:hypothetical protein
MRMAEYIEREALLKWFEPYLGVGETWVEIHPVLDAVHTFPAADVAPVVRCKDCVLHGKCLTEDTFNLCRIENPFCCGGKRKDGDG